MKVTVLFFVRCFEQPAGQVAMPMHGASQHDFSGEDFIEQDVFAEGAKNQKETPRSQFWVRKAARRAEIRLQGKQMAGGFDRVKIPVGNLPTGI